MKFLISSAEFSSSYIADRRRGKVPGRGQGRSKSPRHLSEAYLPDSGFSDMHSGLFVRAQGEF